jgi:hypothetical protein
MDSIIDEKDRIDTQLRGVQDLILELIEDGMRDTDDYREALKLKGQLLTRREKLEQERATLDEEHRELASNIYFAEHEVIIDWWVGKVANESGDDAAREELIRWTKYHQDAFDKQYVTATELASRRKERREMEKKEREKEGREKGK